MGFLLLSIYNSMTYQKKEDLNTDRKVKLARERKIWIIATLVLIRNN